MTVELTKREKVALANFPGATGCSGPQHTLMGLVKAGFLRREVGGLHDHVFRWAPGGEEEAARVRAELAPEILKRLSVPAQEALKKRSPHRQLLKNELGFLMSSTGGPRLALTPLGRAVAELLSKHSAEGEGG